MSQMNKLYKNLTGINIEEQKLLWDERGKGYYGEFLVFQELYYNIPGTSKILMNLQMPALSGIFTEIDLLMIHETGLYVFEVKHYKGTIYGKSTAANWTQYFRTTENNLFQNPINQNQHHINAIRNKYPGIPIYSFIVFTSPACDLRVESTVADTTVCTINDLLHEFKITSRNKTPIFNLIQIDELFKELKGFSPIINETVTINGEAIPFYRYAELLKVDFDESVKQNEKKTKKTIFSAKVACVVFAILMVLICVGFNKQCEKRVFTANQEVATLAQKFEHVENFNNGDIKFSEDLVLVSDVILEPSPDIKNTVNFSCLLTCVGTNYGVSVGEDASLIVILKDGSVKEYDLWNEKYPFSSTVRLGNSIISREGRIGLHEFYDIDISEISYIKLINLGVWSLDRYSQEDVAKGYEIELYCFE